MAAGANISKANIAVASRPEHGTAIGKTNLAVASIPYHLLLANSSSYTLTGTSVALTRRGAPLGPHRQVPAPLGGFAIGSFSTSLRAGRSMAADSGTFVLAGTAATLRHGYTLRAWRDLVGNASGFSDVSDWTIDGADTTFEVIGTRARLTLGPAAHGGYAYKAITVEPGRPYTIKVGLRSTVTSNAGVRLGTTVGGAQLGAAAVAYPSIGAPTISLTGPPGGVIYVQLWSTNDHSCFVDFDFALVEETGWFSIAGAPATLTKTGRLMPAAAGLYALSGDDTAFTLSRRLVAPPGAYTQARQPVGLHLGRTLSAGAGSYIIDASMAAISFITGFFVHAERGALALVGSDARLLVGHVLGAESGNYILSGTDTAWIYRRLIRAEPANYALTGDMVTLRNGHRLNAASGSYMLSGADINLVNYRLTAGAGDYALSGAPARLLAGRVVSGLSGDYVLAATDAALLYGRRLVASPGSYDTSAPDGALLAGRLIAAAAGAYALTAAAVRVLRGYTVHGDPGAYALSGAAVQVVSTRAMRVEPRAFYLNWPNVGLTPTWRPRGPRAVAVGFAASRYLSVAPQTRKAAVEPQNRRLAIEPASRRYAAVASRDKEPEGGSMLQWPEKDPNEVLDYELDWANPEEPRLETGETLLTSTWTVVDGDVVIDQDQTTFTPQGLSTLWLSGGTPSTKCVLLNRVTTSKGRTYDKSVVLRVRDH